MSHLTNSDSLRIGIIGAGPGGLCAGIKLKEAGLANITLFEQAPEIGGTWWHNTYPGCACDVPSFLYSFSFAQRSDWQHPYGTQSEILEYLNEVVERYGLRPNIRLNTGVAAADWDDARNCWRLRLTSGESVNVDVLVGAVGMFNVPAYPEIAGLRGFSGATFHSARWDHAFDLAGKSVAVIGSAASAVQFVPQIAEVVGRLDLYQRTPNWVRRRGEDYTPEQRSRFRADPAAVAAERQMIFRWVEGLQTLDNPKLMRESVEDCLDNLSVVADPEVRRRLTPTYPFGAKRALVSSNWYPTFNRPNVHLITEGIESISRTGVIAADGTERTVDAIILATGFETTRFLSAIPITGRGGVRLDERWARAGAEAYRGITVSGFPNMFMLYGPNTNNGSIIFQIECQVDYLVRHIGRMAREDLAWIDVRPEAMAAYNRQLQADLGGVAVWQSGVSDYYRSASGRIVTQWPLGMNDYLAVTSASDEGDYLCAARS